jgi:hypothetical protein
VAGTAVVVGTVAAAGMAAAGVVATMADGDTGMLATTVGTAAGAGGEAAGIRGGSSRFQCLTHIRITEGTTVQAMDTARDMVMVTGTDTDMDDPQTVTITITKRSELLSI